MPLRPVLQFPDKRLLGRSQEILIMLSEHHFDCPIYFDGMAKEVTRKVLTNESSYVINKDKLHYMLFEKVDLVAKGLDLGPLPAEAGAVTLSIAIGDIAGTVSVRVAPVAKRGQSKY